MELAIIWNAGQGQADRHLVSRTGRGPSKCQPRSGARRASSLSRCLMDTPPRPPSAPSAARCSVSSRPHRTWNRPPPRPAPLRRRPPPRRPRLRVPIIPRAQRPTGGPRPAPSALPPGSGSQPSAESPPSLPSPSQRASSLPQAAPGPVALRRGAPSRDPVQNPNTSLAPCNPRWNRLRNPLLPGGFEKLVSSLVLEGEERGPFLGRTSSPLPFVPRSHELRTCSSKQVIVNFNLTEDRENRLHRMAEAVWRSGWLRDEARNRANPSLEERERELGILAEERLTGDLRWTTIKGGSTPIGGSMMYRTGHNTPFHWASDFSSRTVPGLGCSGKDTRETSSGARLRGRSCLARIQ